MTLIEKAIVFVGLLTAIAFGGHLINALMELWEEKHRHKGD